MADNECFSGSQVAGGSYSQLLFADDNGGLDTDGCYNYNTAFSAENPPKMLCFGEIEYSVIVSETKRTAEKSEITCSDSSTNNSAINSISKANRKRNASIRESAGTGAPSRTPTKKTKSERSDLTGHGKVKREKLGERITALQQLVSPYGKTDTASVLHEAMGYIKFLQEQVQVLCSPYLQTLPPSSQEGENRDGEVRKDLRSRGLCLVPVECTALVANNNGADFWSPAMGNNFSPKP